MVEMAVGELMFVYIDGFFDEYCGEVSAGLQRNSLSLLVYLVALLVLLSSNDNVNKGERNE